MATHELKCWPESFQALLDNIKTFEWRKNDRGYKVGDTLWLREWRPSLLQDSPGEYTGRELKKVVTYIVHGPRFDIPDGYCVMSVRKPVELRRCEKCGGPGPTLYDEMSSGQMCCKKCHHHPEDQFFTDNSVDIGHEEES